MKHSREEQLQAFDRLLTIMSELRQKCPWDHKQTFESLRQNTIEEVNELSAQLIKKDYAEVCKELGDVLLHIVFYAEIASETDLFDIADVCNKLSDKLVFRHPHIYGNVSAENPEEVSLMWEKIKLKEKGGNKTVLGGISDSLPTLIKAFRIQDKVAHVGFDWEKKEDVWDKVKEEIGEFEAELKKQTEEKPSEDLENEFGDILFSLINMARLYDLHPDNALEKTNQKFIQRFNYVEQYAQKQGKQVSDLSLEEMENAWQEAKTKSKNH